MSDPTGNDAVSAEDSNSPAPAAAAEPSAADSATAGTPRAESATGTTRAESAADSVAAETTAADAAGARKSATDSAATDKPASSSAATDKRAAGSAATEKPAAADTTADTSRAVATPTAGEAAGGGATRAKTPSAEAEGESSTSESGRTITRPMIALAATAALLIAAIATSITLFVQNNNHTTLEDARAEAQKAACDYAPILAEYDAKNLDAYFQGVLAGATGDWKDQFEDTSRELRDVLSKGEVISKADDVQCAIKSADETSAEAIVVIGQTITSLGTQGKPAPGQLSMVMRLQKIDGRWLVNNVNSPLAPNQP